MMRIATTLITAIVLLTCMTSFANAADIYFNVAKRKAQLQEPAYASVKQACLAADINPDHLELKPVLGLNSTEGYGSDNRPEAFTWSVMVLGGRALAGDDKAATQLKTLLLSWANAGAFTKNETKHDTYYATKRYMLPVVINYAMIADSMSSAERSTMDAWLDKVIRPLDRKFNGDVDSNNHRYLADSVLMAWGAYSGDDALYDIGVKGYKKALSEANADGSLDLETRRGARATWYMRHALSSLVLIAEVDRQHGGSLYSVEQNGVTIDHIMHYFLTSHSAPLLVMPQASMNYIPGHNHDYMTQDHGYMEQRGHFRHYLAFAEPFMQRDSFAAKRLGKLLTREKVFKMRPLIDEYIGGNATCFFATTGGAR